MTQKIELWLQEISKKHGRKKIWMRVLSFLMAVTVFSTTYALILPAITMDKTYCGIEEHTHSAENGCYTEHKTLICTQEETEEGGHTHTDACYEEQSVLACTLTEAEGHAHSEECYDEEGNLICGLEESEGHQHSQDCYQTEQALVCGQQESEAAGHVHTDTCYETTLELTCEKEEHQHTKACYSNPDADIETASIWESSFNHVELTGVWADDVLAIAASQLGYRESTENYMVEENGAVKGYSRYGAWYGIPYGDWCAMFVSFCLNYAEVDRDLMPIEAGCERWVEKLSEMGIYHRTGNADDKPEAYMPEPGDLIFFDWDDEADADHVGLVYELIKNENGDVTQVKTIEGNNGNRVAYHTYEYTDGGIMGYGELPENPNPQSIEDENAEESDTEPETEKSDAEPETEKSDAEPETEKSDAEPETAENITLSVETDSYVTITMTAPADAFDVPAEELSLHAAAIEDETAKELLEQKASVNDGENVKRNTVLFDICVMHGDEVVQPKKPVQVSFSGIQTPKDDAQVYHVDTETEAVEEMPAEKDENGDIVMEAPHFSVYGVTYTVDFHNGDVTFSIPGESEVLLSAVFAELGIERSVADAASVEFSDPELIAVEKDGEDWKLTSLQSFTTEEMLTITFNDGEIYKIKVTDPPVLGANTSNKLLINGTCDTFANVLQQYGIDYLIDETKVGYKNIKSTSSTGSIQFKEYTNPYGYRGLGVKWIGTLGAKKEIYPSGSATIVWGDAVIDKQNRRYDLEMTLNGLHFFNYGNGTIKDWDFATIYDCNPVSVYSGIVLGQQSSNTISLCTAQYATFRVLGAAPGNMLWSALDLDIDASQIGYESFDEAIAICEGATTKAAIPATNFLNIENFSMNVSATANGLKFSENYNYNHEVNTFNTGFAVLVNSSKFIIRWYGAGSAGTKVSGETKNLIKAATCSISKTVAGPSTNELFDFTIYCKNSSGNYLPGNITYTVYDKNGQAISRTVTKNTDNLQVKLGDGERIDLGNLVLGDDVIVTENAATGYSTSYKLNNGSAVYNSTADFKLVDNSNIAFTNTKMLRTATVKKEVETATGATVTGNEKFDFSIAVQSARGIPFIPASDYTCTQTVDGVTSNCTTTTNGNAYYAKIGDGDKINVGDIPDGYIIVVREYNKASGTWVTTATASGTTLNDNTYSDDYWAKIDRNATITFTNTKQAEKRQVTLKKEVEGTVAADKRFEFDVRIEQPGAGYAAYVPKMSDITIITAAGTTLSGTNKTDRITLTTFNAMIELCKDEQVVIKNIPDQARIYAEETADPASYTIKNQWNGAAVTNGGASDEVTLTADRTLTFTNTMKEEPKTLNVTKEVVNAPANSDELFDFTVDIVNGTTRFVPADGTYKIYEGMTEVQRTITKAADGRLSFQLKDGERFEVAGIPAGYKATITEAANSRYTTTYSMDFGVTDITGSTAEVTMNEDQLVEYKNTLAVTGLTVKKTVVGSSDEDFSFTLSFTDNAAAVIASIQSNTTAQTPGYTVANDTITFALKGGGELTIPGIPAGTELTVTETTHDGYTVKIYDVTAGIQDLIEDGDTATFTLIDAKTIEIQNNPGVELPSTGGIGTHIYTIGGLLLMFAAAVVFVFSKRRRERRYE